MKTPWKWSSIEPDRKITKTYVVSGKGCATAGVLRTSQLPPTPNLHKNRLTGPNQPWLALCYCGMSISRTTVDQLRNSGPPRLERPPRPPRPGPCLDFGIASMLLVLLTPSPRQPVSSHPHQQMVWLYWLQDRDNMPNPYTINHSTTLHIHNETHWPIATRQWHFVLGDLTRRQSCHLLTANPPPRVPLVQPYCRQAQCECWFCFLFQEKFVVRFW